MEAPIKTHVIGFYVKLSLIKNKVWVLTSSFNIGALGATSLFIQAYE